MPLDMRFCGEPNEFRTFRTFRRNFSWAREKCQIPLGTGEPKCASGRQLGNSPHVARSVLWERACGAPPMGC